MQFFTALLSALVLAVSTTATPVHVTERSELVVDSPIITSPTRGEIWPILSQQVVNSDDKLYWELASGFLLTVGSQNVTVPNVPPKNKYVIALIGGSGDLSPEFSIVDGA
ncbi:hypothetical protein EDB85DRAFT_2141002 [Lactarius pseudohatsudake]|nr:hypothetical protein EDB85DRAFT_2141002 [Lactarius pseudohatsudake]